MTLIILPRGLKKHYMSKLTDSFQKSALHLTICDVVIAIIIAVIAVFIRDTSGEAVTGSFETFDYSNGWHLESGEEAEFPFLLRDSCDNNCTLINKLPLTLSDDDTVLIRCVRIQAKVYVGSELRSEYISEDLGLNIDAIPSAYMGIPVGRADAGAEIRIEMLTPVSNSGVESIVRSHGDNAWFDVIKRNAPISIVAVVVLILGVLIILLYSFVRSLLSFGKAPLYMGLLMIDTALWVIAESKMRQFIFNRPSLSSYFSYMTLEAIGILSCMYLDEAQKKKHHNGYVIAEVVMSAQLLVNVLLHFTGIAEFNSTLLFLHLWLSASIVLVIYTFISDIRRKRAVKYKFIFAGTVCFLALCLSEMIVYYIRTTHVYGMMVCIGLIILMLTTVIQTAADAKAKADEREQKQFRKFIDTVETISNAIDAKDEYTGGHSQRVGKYAGILAREMAEEYNLTEADILNIQYIGYMHDIGKIGVADTVLNKAGKLTDEEYMLMKKHVEIGYELMQGINEIEGLLDGVRHHHERFDGKGYPDGLSDTDIPLVARILCLADCYDAMTSNRVYRKRLTDEEVREEILRCAGTQFDPALARIFVKLLDEGKIMAETFDGMALDTAGKLRISTILETTLQRDVMEGKNVLNPTHVRMLSYIVKLMEKKGTSVAVYFVEENDKEITERIRRMVNGSDLIIEYTPGIALMAVFGRTEVETDEFERIYMRDIRRIKGKG